MRAWLEGQVASCTYGIHACSSIELAGVRLLFGCWREVIGVAAVVEELMGRREGEERACV
jgi:hypothetical protein